MKKNKSRIKRLFLFAGYDARGHVDASLIYYVQSLSKYGDVVLHMDNDPADASITELQPYTLHAAAMRHGEYDFGSYKRAYIWARDNLNLSDYDFVYMANDSVYGPLHDLGSILSDMESHNWDAFGPVCNPNPDHPHIQSWFIGMRPDVFMSKWFDKFMMSVCHQADKGTVTKLYEQGFTTAVATHGLSWGCIYNVKNRGVYNKIKSLYTRGMPFMKKVAFTRHNGRLGRQILYVLNHIPVKARDAITNGAKHTFGDKYIDWLLTKNPFKIMTRAISYGITKARKGQL